ncbi:MAG: nucleotidyltransferase family protein, partial [Thermoleophilaceae bacterium]
MEPRQYASPSREVMLTAWALCVDRLTAELAQAFDERGIACLLLKGPVIARWLYDDGTVRSYSDCDLLVAPDQIGAAQVALRDRGFEDAARPMAHPRLDSHEWQHAEHHVDLHCTLIGIGASPRVVWETLWPAAETDQVGGMDVRVLSVPARALHVAVHAAQHGRSEPKPME